VAIAAVFVANGLAAPSFLTRLPERQADLGLSDAGLGLVLAGLAVGALVASPVAGRLVGTRGSRPVAVAAALALGASLWAVGAAPAPGVLFAALAVVGAADAAMDIAMNANAAAYEQASGRSVMHRLHGAWSLGALAGAGASALAAALRVPLTASLAATGAVVAAVTLVSRPRLVVGDTARARAPDRPRLTGRAAWAAGRAALAALAVATVAGSIMEGAPTDWSALRLERLGTGPGVAALGVAAFMAGMLAGRLVGDALTDRHGGAAVLRAGMLLAAAGLLAGAAIDAPVAFGVGLAVAGFGVSAYFPLAFSAAARTPGVAPGAGAATVSLAARLGFLAEPIVMGALAEAVGLRWAFVAVAAVGAALAAAAPRVIPPATRAAPAPIADPHLG
jgi:MFS family permease